MRETRVRGCRLAIAVCGWWCVDVFVVVVRRAFASERGVCVGRDDETHVRGVRRPRLDIESKPAVDVEAKDTGRGGASQGDGGDSWELQVGVGKGERVSGRVGDARRTIRRGGKVLRASDWIGPETCAGVRRARGVLRESAQVRGGVEGFRSGVGDCSRRRASDVV